MPPLSPVWHAHLDRLRELLRLEIAREEASPRRRGRQPTARQLLQQRIRQETVACYRRLHDQGLTLQQCSLLLHLSPRTLRFWEQDCRLETLCLNPVGRPLLRSPLPVRQEILRYLKLTGPGIGVHALQQRFLEVARAELADLLERYRVVWRARHPQLQRVLHWQTAGRVWAADFTEAQALATHHSPPFTRYVLAVRDLASGAMLAWHPLPNLTEEVFQEFLDASDVIPLYSPPSCPMYNGAIEAAIGSLKKRTEDQARQQGRDGQWHLTDLEAAQATATANASHPRRLNGRTPTSVWEARSPIDMVERVVFALAVDRQRLRVMDEQSIAQEEPLDHWRQSAVDRLAIERALVEHGHLLFTRRQVPLRIKAGKVARDV